MQQCYSETPLVGCSCKPPVKGEKMIGILGISDVHIATIIHMALIDNTGEAHTGKLKLKPEK